MRVAVLALTLVLVSAQTEVTWADTTTQLIKDFMATDGNELKAACGSKSRFDQGVCIGFASAIAGVVGDEPVMGWRACIPNGVPRRQLQDVMVKYLDDHPEKLHLGAETLVARAFAEAFPCPQ